MYSYIYSQKILFGKKNFQCLYAIAIINFSSIKAHEIHKMRRKMKIVIFLFSSCVICSLQDTCIIPDDGSKKPLWCKASTIDQFCKDASGIPGNTVVNVLSGTHRLSTICEANRCEQHHFKKSM